MPGSLGRAHEPVLVEEDDDDPLGVAIIAKDEPGGRT